MGKKVVKKTAKKAKKAAKKVVKAAKKAVKRAKKAVRRAKKKVEAKKSIATGARKRCRKLVPAPNGKDEASLCSTIKKTRHCHLFDYARYCTKSCGSCKL